LQQLNWLGCSQGQRAAGRFHVGHSGLGNGMGTASARWGYPGLGPARLWPPWPGPT